MLDVAEALVTEGMTFEQREEFNRLLDAQLAGTGGGGRVEAAQRRAYALAHGEHG